MMMMAKPIPIRMKFSRPKGISILPFWPLVRLPLLVAFLLVEAEDLADCLAMDQESLFKSLSKVGICTPARQMALKEVIQAHAQVFVDGYQAGNPRDHNPQERKE